MKHHHYLYLKIYLTYHNLNQNLIHIDQIHKLDYIHYDMYLFIIYIYKYIVQIYQMVLLNILYLYFPFSI